MNSHSTKTAMGKTGLRTFGLLTGGIFAGLFGLLFPWLGANSIPVWPWVVMGSFWLPALVAPQILQPVYTVWMKIGAILGWINTRIILGIVFFLVVVPIGLLMALMQRGHIREMASDSSTSLRQPSQPRPPSHVERLF